LILFPFRYLWWLVSNLRRSFGAPPDYVIHVLEEEPPALPDPPRPFWQRFTARNRLSLKELGERFDAIARAPRIKGVVLHLRPVAMPMAALEDLRELVSRLRRAGKRVVAWAPFYTTGTYYLACACDEILLMPSGLVQPMGFATTGVFLADGLRRLGLAVDIVQISPYKSAGDMFTKSKMSDEVREQVTWLLDSEHRELGAAIAESRLVDMEGAKNIIDGSPYGDKEAVDGHVVDALVGEEQLPEHLARGTDAAAVIAPWERARTKIQTPAPKLNRGRYVAVLRIEGAIIDGRSSRLPVKPPVDIPFIGAERAGDLTIVQTARQVAADKRAAAVVVYVNSRGGSATASEAMRQALDVIGSRKPLVVVMGPAAASGGYWVATPGSWIVARPSTLTGSIGVFSGKVVTGPLWAKLLFNRETVAFGARATMESDERPYSEEERQIVQREIERIYSVFVDIVARARKMTVEQVEAVAGGKVWTGRQALDRKLVDEMGGLDAGVTKARALAGLSELALVREVRASKRMMPPRAESPGGGWVGQMLESLAALSRAPALALMEYWPTELF
jgi:protease-4